MPLEERIGLMVTYQSGAVASAVAMLIASRDNPPFDLIMTDSANVPDLLIADIIEPVATEEVPKMNKFAAGVRQFDDYCVPGSSLTTVSSNSPLGGWPKQVLALWTIIPPPCSVVLVGPYD